MEQLGHRGQHRDRPGSGPGSTLPARPWDHGSGFHTAGEASRVRREEDRRACTIVGASPVWLPFGEERDNPGVEDDAIWAAIADAVRGADAVLVPGFPLTHSEHEWLARLVLERTPLARRTGLYVEQPYAYGTVVGWRLASPRNLARLGSTFVRTGSAKARQEPRLPDALLERTADTVTWSAVPAGGKRVAQSGGRSPSTEHNCPGSVVGCPPGSTRTSDAGAVRASPGCPAHARKRAKPLINKYSPWVNGEENLQLRRTSPMRDTWR